MSEPLVLRMRSAIQAVLPEGAFLRRDRGDALFITDAPRHGSHPNWKAIGFLCEETNGLARLIPDAGWLIELEGECPDPPNHLCAMLRRFDGPPDTHVLHLFARGLKQRDAAIPDPSYERTLRQLAAVALREHRNVGGLYACALLLDRELNSLCPVVSTGGIISG